MTIDPGRRWEPSAPASPPSGMAPMGIGRVLDVGGRILRRHWAVLLAVALLFIGPGALLTSATAVRFTEAATDILIDPATGLVATDGLITNAEYDRLVAAAVPFLGGSFLASVLSSFGALAFSAVVADDYHARRPGTGAVLRRTLERIPSAFAFMLVTSLIIVGIGLAGIVAMSAATAILPGTSAGGPGVFVALVAGVAAAGAIAWLSIRWLPAYPAMIEERLGWRDALRRSWHLSADNVLRLLAVFVLVGLAGAVFGAILGSLLEALLAGALAPALGLDETVASTLALSAASVVVAPLPPVMLAVLYFDLRTRRDPPPASALGT